MTLYPKLITDALATVTYAGTKKNLIESEMLADTPSINGNKVKIVLIFPRDTDPFLKSTVKAAEAAIHYYVGKEVEVEIELEYKSAPRPEVGKLLPQVKNIIAVSSGKGGVGKSTVSANLAISLARLGYKVGLLDTDIFGPSMPKMFNVEDARPWAEEKDGRQLIVPVEQYGVKLLSIGFFVNKDTATLWRGGMACSALKQLIADADWGDLDFFILDTPPGTSDIHLSLLQTLAITGAIIVSTPQQVALADARKGIDMYTNDKVNVPITFDLAPVVVTASRIEESILKAKADMSVVGREEIEKMHMDNVEEALRTVPGVQFLDYGSNGMNANVSGIRINGSKEVVVLVDGVRVNEFQGSDSGYFFAALTNNTDNIERVEVLRGGAGTLYGSGAKGGVINIITRKINDNKTTVDVSAGNFSTRQYKLNTQGRQGKVGYHVYYDDKHSGDFKDGS